MNDSVREFMSALETQLRADEAWWTIRAVGDKAESFRNAAGGAAYLATEIETNGYSAEIATALHTLYVDVRTFPAIDNARIRVTQSLTTKAREYGDLDDFLTDIITGAGFETGVA